MKRTTPLRCALALACSLPLCFAPLPAQGQQQLDIQIARDDYGIPHIQAPTAAKAFHGLGYIVATDRLFQIEFFRRAMRGTLAEIFSNTTHPKAVVSDVRARRIGFARYAQQAAAQIQVSDPADYALLVAYADGVNKRIQECRSSGNWPFMFETLDEQHMADWTPADCILVWMYPNEGMVKWVDYQESPPLGEPSSQQPDVEGAVLPNGGNNLFAALANPYGLRLLAQHFAAEAIKRRDIAVRGAPETPAMKASHNIVFHGSETANSKPMLLAKPQHRVSTPSTHYEFALKSADGLYDFRGAGLAGSPGVLHGWNRNIAWSLTGMGGDTSDVYKITFTDPTQTSYYVRDRQGVLNLHQVTELANETVVVKDGVNEVVEHKRTIWGPVVSGAFNNLDGNIGVSVRSQILDDCVNGDVSLLGSLQLMRATNKATVVAATRNWGNPGAHMLIGFKDSSIAGQTRGEVGYRGLMRVPLRPHVPPGNTAWGAEVLNGNFEANDWPGVIPFEDMPAMLGFAPFLSTANNLAMDPALLPQPYVIGGIGASPRSWRLEELGLAAVGGAAISFADVEILEHDMVDPVVRELVKLARVMQDAQNNGGPLHGGPSFSPDSLSLLAAIASWGVTDWDMNAVAYAGFFDRLLALTANLNFEPSQGAFPLLVAEYGDRTVGVIRMLRDAVKHYNGVADFYADFEEIHDDGYGAELEAWMELVLARAWNLDTSGFEVGQMTVGHQVNLKPLMDTSQGIDYVSNWMPENLMVDGLPAMHIESIWSQKGEAYKFIADLQNPDNNKALLAPGVSEEPSSPLFLNHLTRWQQGTMYPAPITWGTFNITENILLSW